MQESDCWGEAGRWGRFRPSGRDSAKDFRAGVETSRAESEQRMKELAGLCADTEELVQFLIDQQGQYSQTDRGPVFKRKVDADAFMTRMETIQRTQQDVGARLQKLSSYLNVSK